MPARDTPSKRDKTKEATRQALIQAGQRLFSRDGFDVPSLDALCAEAGFTRGAFYVHFSNREAYVRAVVEDSLGQFVQTLFTPGATVLDVIQRFTTALIEAQQTARPVLGKDALGLHHILHASGRSPEVSEAYRDALAQVVERLVQTTEDAKVQGFLHPALDVQHLATVLLALATGLIGLVEANVPISPQGVGATVTTLLAP